LALRAENQKRRGACKEESGFCGSPADVWEVLQPLYLFDASMSVGVWKERGICLDKMGT
jgi:hypothetical protein